MLFLVGSSMIPILEVKTKIKTNTLTIPEKMNEKLRYFFMLSSVPKLRPKQRVYLLFHNDPNAYQK